MESKKQSNPFSTGGGGVNFETRVQAAFALLLLTKACIPCLPKQVTAKELKFQNKYAGANTDDFVLVALDKMGKSSRLFAQIKHEVTISDSEDSVFAAVINSAWADFNSEAFDSKNDSIALITGPLPKGDVNNTLPLFEWARYASDSKDFINKCNTEGFTSKTKLRKLDAFRELLSKANNGETITDDKLWSFLKVFQILSYDLDSENSIVANLLCSLIECYSNEAPFLVLSKLVDSVQYFNQNAGVLTADNVPEEVKNLFNAPCNMDFESDFIKLQERSELIFNGISNRIKGVHIERSEHVVKISELCDSFDFLFVTGARGIGKSGVVKEFISSKNKDVPVIYLRTEDLDKSHLNDVFASFGMTSSLGQIEGHFSLLGEKILVIESLEKVLELEYPGTFNDLLQYIKRHSGWKVIATGRDYAYQQVSFNYLQPSTVSYSSIHIDEFSPEQIEQLCHRLPELKDLISNPSLSKLLAVPFFIDIAARALENGAEFSSGDSEDDFRTIVWRTVIAKDIDRKLGMPDKRTQTFINVAKARAKQMLFGVRASDFDPEVLAKLEEDNLILRDFRSSTVSPIHDVLEDWALEEFIEGEYVLRSDSVVEFLASIGNEPAMGRAFRLWLYRKLYSDESSSQFVEKLLTSTVVGNYWKDETIAAILQHKSPENFLSSLKSELLKNNCELLIRFCFILRITCQRPHPQYNSLSTTDLNSGISGTLSPLILQPYGNGWQALFVFAYGVREIWSPSVAVHLIETIDEWCGLIDINKELPNTSQIVGLLSIWLLKPIKDSYEREEQQKKLLSALLKVSTSIEEEFNLLMDKEVFISKRSPRRANYVELLSTLALTGKNVAFLCKNNPSFVTKLAQHEWLLQEHENDEFGYFSGGGIGSEHHFGIDDDRDFFPATGIKGPFKYLLQWKPKLGLDFIIKLLNSTAQKYAVSEFASREGGIFPSEAVVSKVSILLNDGSSVLHYSSSFLWRGYRGQTTLPCLLQCALMALENWLVKYIETFNENSQIESIFDYVLRFSNSVMPTSVLASVAIGFPKQVGKAAYPILRTASLYNLDLVRASGEMGGNEHHFFGLDGDVMSKLYIEERRTAALREWRKESLETLLAKLQFHNEHREAALEILDKLIVEAHSSNDNTLRYMVHRADTRKWEAIEDKDNNRVIIQSSSDLPEDLKEDQQLFDEATAGDNKATKLYVWVRKVLDERVFETEHFSSYSDALYAAKELLGLWNKKQISSFANMAVGTITRVAAVCVRDAFENLQKTELEWCIDVILEAISMNSDNFEGILAPDRTDFHGAGACAFVLPKLFELELETEQQIALKNALATAITHADLAVCCHVAKGIREYLWEKDTKLATSFIGGSLEYAKFRKEKTEQSIFHYLRDEELQTAIDNWKNLITKFREDLVDGKFELDVSDISPKSHSPWFFHIPMLMVPFSPTHENQIQLINVLVSLVYENEYSSRRNDDEERIQHDIVRHIQDCFTEHVIHSRNNDFLPFKELLVSGCTKAPRLIYSLVLSFNTKVENEEGYDATWGLWSLLAPEVHKIALNDINDPYMGLQNDLNHLLRGMMYADTPWQGHENEEHEMRKGAVYLLDFAKQSGSNSHVFEALASLIYNFHSVFFPEGIEILSEKYNENLGIISKQVNTAFYLEIAIGRYLQVDNRGNLSRTMYNNCLSLLEGVVETGSARAYYLREHLIRSRRIG